MQIQKITFDEFESLAKESGLALPIEQTQIWAKYQSTIEGRSAWGCLKFCEGDTLVALCSFIQLDTHGYHYLRATHGPIWVNSPTAEDENKLLVALQEFIKQNDKNVAFVRLCVMSDETTAKPVLSTVQYDTTVVVDTTGTEEEILARFKSRGRRDVRKALRESEATCADETEMAAKSFAEYYKIMEETAARDGFAPAPCSDYEDMIRTLGPDHCSVYAARLNGEVVCWSIFTINDGHAIYYYAASSSSRSLAVDQLKMFEFVDLGANKGCLDCDLMGIGSDFAPSLNALNTFKTKFSNEVTRVAPGRDLPIKGALYKSLQLAKKIKH